MSENQGRIHKKRNLFSQVSNHALRDPELSLKAKGLYALIQSYIDIPNFILYKTTLRNVCCEGRDAFESAWKELKTAGYLRQQRVSTGKGHFTYDYELLDSPYSENPVPENPYTANPCADNPDLENPYTAVPCMDNPETGKQVNLKRKEENNIDLNNNDSINPLKEEVKDGYLTIQETIIQNKGFHNYSYFDYIEFVKTQIDFDKLKVFAFFATPENRESATLEWVQLITDIYMSEDDYLFVGKQRHRLDTVKQKLLTIDFSQMIGIFANFTEIKEQYRNVKNPKNYMIAALLNAYSFSGYTALAIQETSF